MMARKIDGYVSAGEMILKPVRLSDGPFLGKILRDRAILKTSGVGRPPTQSWFLLWWWLRKKYIILRRIEVDSNFIGIIGLYNLKPGDSGELTLVIFHKQNRRLGYGTRAVTLFMQDLIRHRLVKEAIVKVITDNHDALLFWEKLGFRELHARDDNVKTFSVSLKY